MRVELHFRVRVRRVAETPLRVIVLLAFRRRRERADREGDPLDAAEGVDDGLLLAPGEGLVRGGGATSGSVLWGVRTPGVCLGGQGDGGRGRREQGRPLVIQRRDFLATCLSPAL